MSKTGNSQRKEKTFTLVQIASCGDVAMGAPRESYGTQFLLRVVRAKMPIHPSFLRLKTFDTFEISGVMGK